jgi:Putative zinc-finger
MTVRHDSRSLGGYVLGALDQQEMLAMDRHLASCPQCRAELADLRGMHSALGGVPPEAWLDGPPDGGDLLWQRTVRQIRQERGGRARKRRIAFGVAAAAVAVAFTGGGVQLGRTLDTSSLALPAGTRTAEAVDTGTGAHMTVQVQPASGWVRLKATVEGIPAGEKCRLFVVSRNGSREEAGGWLVSPDGTKEGTSLDGAALVAPADVAAVEVENFDGKKYVAAAL